MHIEHQPTRGVSVPAVVVTRDGTDFAEVAGGCLVLLHFIAGDVLGDDFSCALQIAAFLADFHQQSTAFTGPFCSDRSEFALFRATQHDVHGNAECGIIHHDLHSGNFLVDAEDGAITAMLDFSEGHYGMLVFDLAILLGSWEQIAQVVNDVIHSAPRYFGRQDVDGPVGTYARSGYLRRSCSAPAATTRGLEALEILRQWTPTRLEQRV